MERAGGDRSARQGRPGARTLDSSQQDPGGSQSGEEAGQDDGAGQPGSRPLAVLRAAAGRPVARHLALLIVYVAAGVAVTWPRATYLTAGQLPSLRDESSYVWGFWWMAHQITHLGNPWFTHSMTAPVGVQLGFHTLMPLPGLLLTPVTLLFGPAASYTLLVLLTPGLLCYATYRVARLWLPSATGAIAAGAFFGLSAMLCEQAWYHLNIALGAVFMPLALEASVRLRRKPGTRQAVILGAVMGAAVLTDQESAVQASIVTALALLPWLLRHPAPAKFRPAALAVVIGTVIASPQIIAMAQEVAIGGLTIDPHTLAVSYKQYGIGLPGMFSPTPRVGNFGLGQLAVPFQHSRDNEQMPMFGALLTLLALGGLAAAWRRVSARLLGLLWAGCAVLALGASLWLGKTQYLPLGAWWHGVRVSNLMPYTWFVRIPGLSSFREADRLAILGLLPAALLAGAAVNWLRYHARPLIVIVLALGVLEAGYAGRVFPQVQVIPDSFPAVDRGIRADHSQSIVVDLSYGIRGGIPVYGLSFDPKALVMATADGHPRAIGYVSRVSTNTISAIDAHPFYRYLVHAQHGIHITPAHLAAARQDVHRMHIGWLIVWRRSPQFPQSILPYLHMTGFQFGYRVGSVLVYHPAPR
jgi:hypothetical protein